MSDKLIGYRKRVLDTKSKSFCGAKWYNATTWLGSGTTASCHHPPAQWIDPAEVAADHTAIHNTKHKKEMRRQMQTGERPRECEYCWKMEDMKKDNGEEAVSDRVFKSIIYTEEELQEAYERDHNDSVDLKTFEISFDRVCNLACSYCNASFSTTWAKDIKKNGPYENLVSDGAGAFHQNGDWVEPYDNDEDNPYIQAFWKWWDEGLSKSLQELRVTGGEPLMSGNTWKLLDWFDGQETDMQFAINSNLIAKDDIVTKLIDKTKNIKNFHLYTSAECYGKHQEYVRDGFVWETWTKNLNRMLDEGNCKGVHVMMTINSLCLFSITQFMDEMYKIKEKNMSKSPSLSLNVLRFPSFQSPLALPNHIKDYLHAIISNWWKLKKVQPYWHEFEKASIERLIDYLVTVDAPHRRTSNPITLYRDFKTFYKQYDERRGKNMKEVFPPILTEWMESIPDTDREVQELAEKEGWIINPPKTNIDDPTATYD